MASTLHAAASLFSAQLCAPSCAEAVSAFCDKFPQLFKHILLSHSRRQDAFLSVPWCQQPVRVQHLLGVADKLTHKVLLDALRLIVPGHRLTRDHRNRKEPCIVDLVEQLEFALADMDAMTDSELHEAFLRQGFTEPPASFSRQDIVLAVLANMWPEDVLIALMTVSGRDDLRVERRAFRAACEVQRGVLRSHASRLRNSELILNWPPVISRFHRIACMSAYFKATQFVPPGTCACCGQRRVDVPVRSFPVEDDMPVNIEVLRSVDDWLLGHACRPLVYRDERLNGLVLDSRGLRMSDGAYVLDVCPDCETPLRNGRRPRVSLRNGLYRGILPEEFRDLSWVEEQICAINVVTCKIVRLHGSSNPENPFVLYGNTCAHPLNAVETASVLPRSPTDIAGRLGVIFVGPKRYKPKALGEVFRVRKTKILRFLRWLVAHNKLYQSMPIDPSLFDLYPDDGPLPGIDSRIVHREVSDPEADFQRETAGLDDHPAMAASFDAPAASRRLGEDEEFVFMDALGLTDAESLSVDARTFEAAALSNLLPVSMRTPDLTFHRGSNAVPEYGNCNLFPSLFPTLYPYGIGGFEDWSAQREGLHVGFRSHASYLLHLADRSFSTHRTFVFLVTNILQRRTVHSQTSFRTRSSYVDSLSEDLVKVSSDQIRRVADHFRSGGGYDSVPAEDSAVINLLRIVEAVSTKVPGTHGAKLDLRRAIFASTRHFAIPQVFFTMNPNPVHNPLFHLMCGDETVDLSKRYPAVVDAIHRSLRVAADPAAAADFFQLSIRLMFEHLFGWDFEAKRSRPGGGVLGEIQAFSVSIEQTGRGIPHAHILITLKGAPNPRQIRQKLNADSAFPGKFFAFWDAAIHHHLPAGYDLQTGIRGQDPRDERPPEPPAFTSGVEDGAALTVQQRHAMDEWEDVFQSEVKVMGEKTQRHTHKPVCYAYGHKECRFQFPHPVEEKSYYDSASNSIVMRALDSTVNYFNPEVLVMTRCNHDMKCILSGGDTQAAIYYITSYITKMDINDSYLLSLMTEAVEQLEGRGVDHSLRTMLHKCLARITGSLQIHAQQAVRYIRGNTDYILSHDVVPMMSAVLMKHVKGLYDVSELGTSVDADDDATPVGPDLESGEDDEHDPSFAVYLDADGNLRFTNQVEDYVYRPKPLEHLCFYDYVSLVKCVRKTGSRTACFELHANHSRSDTHCLTYRHPLGEDDERVEHVPMMIGTKVPRRSNTDYYRLFCLAHFKPFGHDKPLIESGSTVEAAYAGHEFSATAARRMQNWEDLFECEDERDADRLRKQANKARNRVTTDGDDALDENEGAFTAAEAMRGSAVTCKDTLRFFSSLSGAGWFNSQHDGNSDLARPLVKDSINDSSLRSLWKTWHKEIKDQDGSALCGEPLSDSVRNDAAVSLGFQEADTGPPVPAATVPNVTTVPTLTREFAMQVAADYNLNPEQSRAYRVIVEWLLSYIRSTGSVSSPRPPPLRMILHGAGGTGKTYSLRPLQDLLDAVNHPDAIARVAPTGTAASLINGRTVHAAMKLRVDSMQEMSSRRFEVSWSPANRKHLQDMFGSAVLLLLDEFSLASTQMLGQIDVALRVARQNWSEPFGGMAVVLSGDLCQYEPVSGNALWSPLSPVGSCDPRKDDSLEKLGRMAYLSFDTVIEFTRQERMRGDPAYAAAVKRLRTRQCTPDDVRLFNTRVVKSDTRPNGVDLDSEEWVSATTIVTRNETRRLVNAHKAESYGRRLPRYFDVAARDRLTSNKVDFRMTASIRRQVLDMKLKVKTASSKKSKDILPGRLKMYEGMPVMLRGKNISVHLKATNGAQGTLRGISVSTDEFGHTVANVALVELPESPARLTGLPPGVVPIAPMTCTFPVCVVTERDGGQLKQWLTAHRRQLPVEGAFCITGHSAQGKTLLRVVCYPAPGGGFYVYVTLSRPRSLDCLALLAPVTLEILNEPLHRDLRFELNRLAALAHNTAVRAGDILEPLVPVPVHERESRDINTEIVGKEVPDGNPSKRSNPAAREAGSGTPNKRRRIDAGGALDSGSPSRPSPSSAPASRTPARSRRPFTGPDSADVDFRTCRLLGPRWNSTDWSCSYDAAFMALYSAWFALGRLRRTQWSSVSPTSHTLSESFTVLQRPVHAGVAGSVVHYRDRFRQHLNSLNPADFPLSGALVAEITPMLQLATTDNADHYAIVLEVDLDCVACDSSCSGEIYLAPFVAGHDPLNDQWIEQAISRELVRSFPLCCEHIGHSVNPASAPPIFHISVHPDMRVTPARRLSVGGVRYALASVVYTSGDAAGTSAAHFTCALLLGESVYSYDGMVDDGRPNYLGPASQLDLTVIGAGRACSYVFCLADNE